MKKLVLILPLILFASLNRVYGAGNPALIPAVASISQLQALGVAAPLYQTVFVQNYASGRVGGGGTFVWNPTSTASSDGCTIFPATGVTTGRYVRVLSTASINVDMCGADPTAGTSSRTAFANAIAWCRAQSGGCSIDFDSGASYAGYFDFSSTSGARITLNCNRATIYPDLSSPTNGTIVYINNSGLGGGYGGVPPQFVNCNWEGKQHGGNTTVANYLFYLNGAATETNNNTFSDSLIADYYCIYCQYTRDTDSFFTNATNLSFSQAVTGTANNGSGAIRVALASTSGLTSGQIVSCSGIGGTTEANAAWQVSVVDSTHVDLSASTYTNAYTSGGTCTAGAWGMYLVSTDISHSVNEVSLLRSRLSSNWGGLFLSGGDSNKFYSLQFQTDSGPGIALMSDATGRFASGNKIDGAWFESDATDIILGGAKDTTIISPYFGAGVVSTTYGVIDSCAWNTTMINPGDNGVNNEAFGICTLLSYAPTLEWIGGDAPLNVPAIRSALNPGSFGSAKQSTVLIQGDFNSDGGNPSAYLGNFVQFGGGFNSPNGNISGYKGDVWERIDASTNAAIACVKTTNGGNTGWVEQSSPGTSC